MFEGRYWGDAGTIDETGGGSGVSMAFEIGSGRDG